MNLNFSVFQAGKPKKKESKFAGPGAAKDVKKQADDKVVAGAVVERATPTIVPAPPPAPPPARAPVAAPPPPRLLPTPFKGIPEDGRIAVENKDYFDLPESNYDGIDYIPDATGVYEALDDSKPEIVNKPVATDVGPFKLRLVLRVPTAALPAPTLVANLDAGNQSKVCGYRFSQCYKFVNMCFFRRMNAKLKLNLRRLAKNFPWMPNGIEKTLIQSILKPEATGWQSNDHNLICKSFFLI